MRGMSRLGTLARTVRHLKTSQFLWRGVHVARVQTYQKLPGLGSILVRPDADARPASLPTFSLPAPDPRSAYLWREGFVEYQTTRGDRNDWRSQGRSKLWRYEHQYHSELPALAMLSTDDACALVHDWLANNPPCSGEAWEPYPVARRLLNWSLACALTPALRPYLAPWLAGQMRFLAKHLERHLLGNHLLCDLCGLVAASATVENSDSETLGMRAANLLERELNRQILPDGGYAERTVQYHLIVLQDALLALMLHQARGRTMQVGPVLNRMLAWAHTVRRADGSFPWLNDAAPDTTPSFDTVVALAQACGLAYEKGASPPHVLELPDTGWSIVRKDRHELLFEHGVVGPEHQPGHGHADALSFELIWAGSPLVSDTGVTTYTADEVRRFERSAEAHAAVSVNGEGADETWASFRVGGRSRVQYLGHSVPWPGSFLLRGRVQSYRGWTHRRGLLFWPGQMLLVCDEIRGAPFGGEILASLPLAPDWRATAAGLERCSLASPSLQLEIATLKGRLLAIPGRSGWIGRGFGRRKDRLSLGFVPDDGGQCVYGITFPDVRVSLQSGRLIVRSATSTNEIELDRVLP